MYRESISAIRFSVLFSFLILIILINKGCKKDNIVEKENSITNITDDEDFLNWANTKRPEWVAFLLPVNNETTKLNRESQVGILISNLEQLKVARLVYRNRLAAKLGTDTGEVEGILLKHYQNNAKKLDSLVAKRLLFNKTWPVYQQLYLNTVQTSRTKIMGVQTRSFGGDLGGVEITACRVSHLYSMIQDLNNQATSPDCFNILGRLNDLMSQMTSISNPSLSFCSQMELTVFSCIDEYARCIIATSPGNLGLGGGPGAGGGGGGPGPGQGTGPIFGENGQNTIVSTAKFNELLTYVTSVGLTISDPFKDVIRVDGVEHEGESIVIYDSDNNVVAYYFTPNTTSTIFPLGYYYSIGNGRPSLNLSSYSFDFGPPAIIPGGIRSYTGGKVDDVVIPNMVYPAEWHEIEDSFGVLIPELANQGIDNGDPIPDMYYRNDGTPIDMQGAPAKGRTVLGVPRNSGYFWRELYKKRPEMFSPENKDKIFRKPNGISPEVDEQWIRYNPSHKPYDKTPLIHHHDRQGRYAYALPAKVHQKWSKIFHEIRSKGGISKIGGKLNSVAGALQIFSILTDLRTGNPDGWINWFGPQNIIGRIYKDNEKDVYFQITSKEETRNSSGTVISAVVTYHVFADYVWDDDENMYMGVQKLGTYTETIDVINAKTIRRSFGII